MQPFTRLTGIAAPLSIVNIDTDMIIPKQFLKTIKRTGLGKNLFDEMRYAQDGAEIPDFILNREPYRQAQIIIAGENFGCGSSREHAPWALLDFGIRAIIAPSFADIFFNNCFKNGILPIVLPKEKADELMALAKNSGSAEMTIDLEAQQLRAGNKTYAFNVEPFRKHCLLNGLDDIGLTMHKIGGITAYEASRSQETPWLF